jgi:hypothetical protein
MRWCGLDRGQRGSLVNTVLELRLQKILGNSGVTERLAVSEEGLISMELVRYYIHKMLDVT